MTERSGLAGHSAAHEQETFWAQSVVINGHGGRCIWPECIAFDQPEAGPIHQSETGRIRRPEAGGFSNSIAGGGSCCPGQNCCSLR